MRNCGKQSSKGSRLKKYAQTSAGNEDEHGKSSLLVTDRQEAVAKGITAAGGSAECVAVSDITPQDLAGEAVFALGCPAMGAEVLEESEMEPFVEELEKSVSGKKIGLFGSYGWGDGQWMRDWEERMTAAGATVLNGEGLICQETPDDDAIKQCEELGEQLAQNA